MSQTEFALASACRNGELETVVNLLLDNPTINVNPKTMKISPLYAACESENLLVLERILQVPVLNINDGLMNPLHAAARAGNVEIARRLLQVPGIDVNKKSSADKNKTPLIEACGIGAESIVEILLEHPGIDLYAEDDLKRTAFSIACIYGFETIADRLMHHPSFELSRNKGPLEKACESGMINIVQKLLQCESLPIEENSRAIYAAAKNNHLEIVKTLFECKQHKFSVQGFDGEALAAAIRHGNHAMACLLIENGADPANMSEQLQQRYEPELELIRTTLLQNNKAFDEYNSEFY